MPPKKQIYKVIFYHQAKIYEVYARNVSQGGLFGFIEVEGLLFGEKSSVVVDPSEEALQREFSGVERTYIPMHAVLRVDEVEKRGSSKILPVTDMGGNITAMPTPIYTPVKKDN